MDDLTAEELLALELKINEIMAKYGESYEKVKKSVYEQFEAQKEIIENLEEIIQNSNDVKKVRFQERIFYDCVDFGAFFLSQSDNKKRRQNSKN